MYIRLFLHGYRTKSNIGKENYLYIFSYVSTYLISFPNSMEKLSWCHNFSHQFRESSILIISVMNVHNNFHVFFQVSSSSNISNSASSKTTLEGSRPISAPSAEKETATALISNNHQKSPLKKRRSAINLTKQRIGSSQKCTTAKSIKKVVSYFQSFYFSFFE